jgi:hypothetical protein
MSWNVFVQKFSQKYTNIEDIPETEQCLPIGSSLEVQTAISQIFSETEWDSSSWGHYSTSLGLIEFDLGLMIRIWGLVCDSMLRKKWFL